MGRKVNFELANLLQDLSNSLNERDGRDAMLEDNDRYLKGVKKAIPEIDKVLAEIKQYLNDK